MQLGKIHIFLTGICMYTELSVVVVVVFFLSLGYQTIFFFLLPCSFFHFSACIYCT